MNNTTQKELLCTPCTRLYSCFMSTWPVRRPRLLNVVPQYTQICYANTSVPVYILFCPYRSRSHQRRRERSQSRSPASRRGGGGGGHSHRSRSYSPTASPARRDRRRRESSAEDAGSGRGKDDSSRRDRDQVCSVVFKCGVVFRGVQCSVLWQCVDTLLREN